MNDADPPIGARSAVAASRPRITRRVLDGLFDAAAYLAAFFMVGTLAMVLLAIVGRLLNRYVPGTDAYAGYCMAASGFLALAHTLKRGEHIRVSLILEHVGVRARRGLELFALAVATLLAGAFAFYSTRLAFQSWQFNDISTANDATPLWIPQLAMALGTIVLFVAFADELVAEWRGVRRIAESTEALHYE
jgi:TRAP-type C4-dicarboxylate transport system permease small subunit